jgi:hypothetical protein
MKTYPRWHRQVVVLDHPGTGNYRHLVQERLADWFMAADAEFNCAWRNVSDVYSRLMPHLD